MKTIIVLLLFASSLAYASDENHGAIPFATDACGSVANIIAMGAQIREQGNMSLGTALQHLDTAVSQCNQEDPKACSIHPGKELDFVHAKISEIWKQSDDPYTTGLRFYHECMGVHSDDKAV